MATSFPLLTLAAAVTATGITIPPYADIYESLQASFKLIYGTDAYLDPDSQDGQLLAVFARAVHDGNRAAVAVYNSFSPATAQGVQLDNSVALNGIQRKVSTPSQANVLISGVVGTQIAQGIITDALNTYTWLLPAAITIPVSGQILVTATLSVAGAVEAAAGTLTSILTPTLGWQSVTNPTPAAPGAAVEVDAQLRKRQARSTALPSRTVLAGILGAVQAVEGVTEAAVYENDSNAVDGNGLPPHSISVVALGGAPEDVALAIAVKKTPGAGTYGTTAVPVTDAGTGLVSIITYFVPTPVAISVQITWEPLAGFTTAVRQQVADAVAAYINNLPIGARVDIARLYLPAQLYGGDGSATYNVNNVQAGAGALTANDITLAFNAFATCTSANVTFVLG